jgi:hypothetical protein
MSQIITKDLRELLKLTLQEEIENLPTYLEALNELILPNLPEEIKNKVELFIKNQTKSFS